eukprot:8500069-Pyramimonas_sp.AAC.1
MLTALTRTQGRILRLIAGPPRRRSHRGLGRNETGPGDAAIESRGDCHHDCSDGHFDATDSQPSHADSLHDDVPGNEDNDLE